MKVPFVKPAADPKRELPVMVDDIADVMEGGTIYEDIYISKTTFINAIIAGNRGVFVFIAYDDKDKLDLLVQAKEVKDFLPVSRQGLFIFFLSDNGDYVAEQDFKSLIELDDFLDSLKILYTNLSRPAVDLNYLGLTTVKELIKEPETPDEYRNDNTLNGATYERDGVVYEIKETYEREDEGDPEYVRPVVDKQTLEAIDQICSRMMGNYYPDASYRVDEEGNEYILRDGSVKIKGVETGLIGEKRWYRISDKDSLQTFWITVLGGWTGIHRLMTGDIFMAVTYFLTCGFGGVFYILDVLAWLFGNASYSEVNYYEDEESGKLIRTKDKVYFKPLQNKLTALLGLVISAGITALVLNVIYKPAYSWVLQAMINSAAQGGK